MEDMLKKILMEIQEIKQDNVSMKADIANLNHNLVPKVNAIYDGISGIQEKFNRLDTLETKIENHDDRIFALEQNRKAN